MVASGAHSTQVQVAGDITPASSDASSVTVAEESGAPDMLLEAATPLPKYGGQFYQV